MENRAVYHDIHTLALAMLNNIADNKERNRQHEMDSAFRTDTDRLQYIALYVNQPDLLLF